MLRAFFLLVLLAAAPALAQTRAPTVIPRIGFRDAIIVRVQQIDPNVHIERSDDLSFTIAPGRTLVSLELDYQQYAAAPGTLGLVIEQVAREAIATARRAPAARLVPPPRPVEHRAETRPQRASPPADAPRPPAPQPLPQPRPPQTPAELLAQGSDEVQPLDVQTTTQRAANVRMASLIRSRASLANLDPTPLSRPFLGDLVEILVVDGSPAAPESLEELNLTADEAWARVRRDARVGRFTASPLERYGAVVRLTANAGMLFDPGTCTRADQGNRLFLVLGPDAIATADRRTPGAEGDFFRLLRDVAPTAYSTTPVTCRAGAWEIARRQGQ